MKLQDLPIRHKLTLGALAVSGTALFVALLAWGALQIHLARRTAARDLEALAQVVANNAVGPLAFRDRAGARHLLDALHVRSEIVRAELLDNRQRVYGRFEPDGNPGTFLAPPRGQRIRLDGFEIFVAVPVVHGRERLGTLELTTNVRGTLLKLAAVSAGSSALVLAAALLLAALLARRWQRAITGPLVALANTARVVAASKDYTLRTPKRGNDEIGGLTDAFNHMLAEIHHRDLALRDAQAQLSAQVDALQREIRERQRAEAELDRTHQDLVEASRRAGQAEVATSVLHNVGNVLNSVGVSASIATDRLRGSRLGNVGRAGQLLLEHRDQLGPFFTEAKGQMLLEYLPELARSLDADREAIAGELSELTRNLEHIKGIVAMQQSYARVSGGREVLRPVEIIEHALALNAESITRHRITVVRHYHEIPAFAIDKHRVLQILVNLIANAKNALTGAESATSRTLSITLASADGRIAITVADNGIGIAPENLARLFQHGFTTRRDGHGFGLHSGALAAQQMGGRLHGTSAGPGHGAAFTLELPIDGENA